MRKYVIYVAALSLSLLMTALSPTSALAHAKFVKSEPAPDSLLNVGPTQATIWFSEELDTRTGFIKVSDAVGTQVDVANSMVNLDDRTQMTVGLKPLINGVYTVKWHGVSAADKDELDGEFKFTVAISQPASPLPAPTARSTTAAPLLSSTPLGPTPTAIIAPTALSSAIPVANLATASAMAPLIALSILVLGAGVLLVLRKQ